MHVKIPTTSKSSRPTAKPPVVELRFRPTQRPVHREVAFLGSTKSMDETVTDENVPVVTLLK